MIPAEVSSAHFYINVRLPGICSQAGYTFVFASAVFAYTVQVYFEDIRGFKFEVQRLT